MLKLKSKSVFFSQRTQHCYNIPPSCYLLLAYFFSYFTLIGLGVSCLWSSDVQSGTSTRIHGTACVEQDEARGFSGGRQGARLKTRSQKPTPHHHQGVKES